MAAALIMGSGYQSSVTLIEDQRCQPIASCPCLWLAAGGGPECCELYLQDLRDRAAAGARRGKLSTAAEFERLLQRKILPKIGAQEAESLALPEIEAMHRSLRATPRGGAFALSPTGYLQDWQPGARL